jgi:YD repeat-containing protein
MNRVVQETDALGNTIQYTYDPSNNVIQTVETDVSQIGAVANETFTTQFIYDNLNRLTQEIDNCSNTRRWAYDSRGDMTNDTDAKGDNASGCAGTVNAHGNSTLYTYDGQSRWLTVSEDLRNGGIGLGTATSQIALSHTYDGNGRLASLTDSTGNTYRYQYDSLNRVVTETFPDNTTKTYTYDHNNNTRTVTDNNGTTWTNTYDNVDRLTATSVTRSVGVIGTTSNTFQYDGVHRKTRLADNNDPLDPASASTLGLAYDSLGRVVEETQNGLAVDSGWTAHARRTSLAYPNGRRVDFAFDLLERIQGVQDHGAATGLAGYSYMGPGRVIQRSYQNGTRLTYLNAAGTVDTGYDALRRTVARNDLRTNNSVIVGFDMPTTAIQQEFGNQAASLGADPIPTTPHTG